ncbi:MAG: cupin domain-containing protein [Acidobacteria bacterium]|nr:cupin domain-containing protein [Acidobacteriota bacterium]
MTAEDVKKLLRLEPHPREGGWFMQTYAAVESIPVQTLFDRYNGARRLSTAIFYLLEPDTFSEMHRLRSDEMFHFYAGDAVEMLQLLPGGTGRSIVIGNDLLRGQKPQVLVEHDVWQGARLIPGGAWALLGCTVAPGFEYEDYDSASRSELTALWPEFAGQIAELTRR